MKKSLFSLSHSLYLFLSFSRALSAHTLTLSHFSLDISLPEICRGSIRSVWAVFVSFYLSPSHTLSLSALSHALILRVCLRILTELCANKFLDIALLFSVSAIKLRDQSQNRLCVNSCAPFASEKQDKKFECKEVKWVSPFIVDFLSTRTATDVPPPSTLRD